jgi:hypothetical protein
MTHLAESLTLVALAALLLLEIILVALTYSGRVSYAAVIIRCVLKLQQTVLTHQ